MISILLPSLQAARESAKSLKCLSNLKGLATATYIYATERDGVLPVGEWRVNPNGAAVGPFPARPEEATAWDMLLRQVLGQGGGVEKSVTKLDANTIFACPSAAEVTDGNLEDGIVHYSAHPRLMPVINFKDPGYPGFPQATPYKLGQVGNSSEIMMYGDGTQVYDGVNTFDIGNARPVFNRLDDSAFGKWTHLLSSLYGDSDVPADYTPDSSIDGGRNLDYVINVPETAGMAGNIRWRHNDGERANFAFVDGHAEGHQHDAKTRETTLLRRNIHLPPTQ